MWPSRDMFPTSAVTLRNREQGAFFTCLIEGLYERLKFLRSQFLSEFVELVMSYKRAIVPAEAHERSELEPGLQKNTGDRPVRM
jgi:hypothetical protein